MQCESVRSPGTRVTDNCEPPCDCWELNSGPQEEQQVLLTSALNLQLHDGILLFRETVLSRSYVLINNSDMFTIEEFKFKIVYFLFQLVYFWEMSRYVNHEKGRISGLCITPTNSHFHQPAKWTVQRPGSPRDLPVSVSDLSPALIHVSTTTVFFFF